MADVESLPVPPSGTGDVTTRIIQVTNLAPQATRDQMHALFSMLLTSGKSIEEIRVYPTVRDMGIQVQGRVAFIKFSDPKLVALGQHLSNTVFIDRAMQVTPVQSGEVPDEDAGLQMAAAPNSGSGTKSSKQLPPHVVNRLEGVAPNAYIMTHDPRLDEAGLPQYPPLPASTSSEKVEEIRRTVCVIGLDSTVSAQQSVETFSKAGEVKFFRHCTRENDSVKYGLIEFTEQSSVVEALKMNDLQLGMSRIKVTHALQAITKPQAKSNEAAQREIEEAMSRVKEAQSLVSAAVDPLMGILTGVSASARNSQTRSRSRSKSRRRSRERSSYSRRRSRSRDRRRRSRTRSRSRDRRRSRSRDRRRRSRSRDRKRSRRSRSRSRDRDRKRRDRDEDKDKDKDKDKEKKKPEEGEEEKTENDKNPETESAENGTENGKKSSSKTERRSRSRSRDRRRSRSRDRKRRSRSRSRDRKKSKRSRRSPSRERRRSRSRDRKHRSRSRDRRRRSRSKEKKNKVSRDYDQEEKGFEAEVNKEQQVNNDNKPEENLQAEDMEISNSP